MEGEYYRAEARRNGGDYEQTEICKKHFKNEWLAADLVQLARKNPLAAEEEIAEILNNLCTTRGLHDRVRRAEEKVDLVIMADLRERESR